MTAHPTRRDQLLYIAREAVAAVSPEPALRHALTIKDQTLTVQGEEYDLSAFERILLLGAGKGAAAMAKTMESLLGDRISLGLVATKYGHGLELSRTRVLEAGHPVPDRAGQEAADRLLSLARQATEKDLVIFLLSGGASAILPAPREPATLEIKQEITRRLLQCGASIQEINAVRKHLSRFKGGHFAKALEPATVITLILSDVVGDDLDVIGSGPTAPDTSTFLDCQTILDRYRLCADLPDVVQELINQGCAGKLPETRKPDDPCFDRVRNHIVAGNAMALEGASQAARDLGFTPVMVDTAMTGEARDMAHRMVGLAREYATGAHGPLPVCLLAGGETTVTLQGAGKGGRNQELALAAALDMADLGPERERMGLISLGTDGTDGPTDAAGAMALPDTVGTDPDRRRLALASLAGHDSYHFHESVGTLVKTGPTLTNVMDVVALLVV